MRNSTSYDGTLPGTTTRRPLLDGGRQPAHVRYSCPVCGLSKRFGARAQRKLAGAISQLGAVDISLLPF